MEKSFKLVTILQLLVFVAGMLTLSEPSQITPTYELLYSFALSGSVVMFVVVAVAGQYLFFVRKKPKNPLLILANMLLSFVNLGIATSGM